jgi:hypothetical protein
MFDHALLDRLNTEAFKGNVFKKGDDNNYVLFEYSFDCIKEKKWNDTNKQARGIIFYAPTAKVACRPFSKFFNMDELPETKLENLPLDQPFIIWEKLDGSCCCAYNHFGELRCSTPGSMESPQAIWATQWLNDYLKSKGLYDQFFELINDGHTFIFEGIWPESKGNPAPPVLNYEDREELVLLSVRKTSGMELSPIEVDSMGRRFGFSRPRRFEGSIDRTLMDKVGQNEEGYVIQFLPSNLRVKVKSPTYVALHRIKDKISIKGIVEMLAAGESRKVFSTLPEHLRKKTDDILAALYSRYYDILNLLNQVVDTVKNMATRKDQALYILKHLPKTHTSAAFLMLDNNFSDREVWKVLEREFSNA